MDLKKELGGVADAVTKIMDEALKGDQHKIDANKNNKIDAHDFKLLRSKKKVEEAAAKPDFIDLDKDGDKKEPMKKAASDKKMKEEVEELDELSKDTLKSYRVKSIGRDARIEKKGYEAANKDGGAGSDRADQLFNKADLVTAARKRAQEKMKEKMRKEDVELTQEEFDQLDEVSKKLLRSYLKGSKAEAESQLRGDVSDKAASLGRTQQDKDDGRYEGGRLAKRKLGTPGTIPAKVMAKEAAEQIAEYKSTGGVYKHKGTYGTEKSLEAGYTDYDKENELAKKNLKDKKPKKYGARQNFVRSTRVNESFTSILASYKENGLKGISEMFATEQASQEEYEKEIEKAKAKSQGKDKAEVAKASVQAVKSEQTHTKIEVIDMSDPYNIQKREIDLEEREMTDAEMEKKEEIVKSMKKGMKGFKERYGERAKEVMYATATKQAMKD
jgi:hypothetical protein